jgi:hypothetical protein
MSWLILPDRCGRHGRRIAAHTVGAERAVLDRCHPLGTSMGCAGFPLSHPSDDADVTAHDLTFIFSASSVGVVVR